MQEHGEPDRGLRNGGGPRRADADALHAGDGDTLGASLGLRQHLGIPLATAQSICACSFGGVIEVSVAPPSPAKTA